jgi:hypothetical protein
MLLLVCALAALLVLFAGTASGKPGYVVKPENLRLSLSLPASNGYSASIQTEGRRKVRLKVFKGSIASTYVARGRVSRKGIEADFGDFGQVSLRFKRTSRFTPRGPFAGMSLPDYLHERCKGRPSQGEKGVFLGNVSFDGERGYTQIASHRLGGKVVRTYKRVCKPGVDPFAQLGFRPEVVSLGAGAQDLGVRRFVVGIEISMAISGEKLTSALVVGGERKRVGDVGIAKRALAFVDSLEVSPAGRRPVTAEVTSERPFEGTASYLGEGQAPPTWSGTLGVRLPGSGLVPLAGPEFEAEICRGSGKAGLDRCTDSISASTGLAQGSGSHSQPLALARLSSLR